MRNKILAPSFYKYWNYLVLTLLFALAAAVFEGLSLGLLIPFLQTMADGEVFQTGHEWVDQFILGIHAPAKERLVRICGLIFLSLWARAGFSYLSQNTSVKAKVYIVEDLRMRMVDQLQAVALRFYSQTRAGELLNSLTQEIARVGNALMLIANFTSKFVMLVVYLAFMLWASWKLSLLVITVFGLLSWGLTWFIRQARRFGGEVTLANADFTSTASEFINSIRIVHAFNAQAFERARLQQVTNRVADATVETLKRGLAVGPITQGVIGSVLIAVVLIATLFLVLPGVLDVAVLLAFLFAMFRMMPIVQQISTMRGQWAGLSSAMDKVADLLKSGDKPYLQDGQQEAPALTEGIVFEDVDFAYEEGHPVLHSVHITIEAGKTTALVGGSGAGKSTLADLMLRFYDPTAGRVLWNGDIDLRELRMDSFRRHIAVVSQDSVIFNDTVAANIAYGLPNTAFEEIWAAAEQANALGFIEDLPERFDTVLGDRGVRLSGGQRQRIAIARAILRKPEVLILDEATSALDSISEQLVQQSLEQLMEGRTVIAIAHRLSTIESADWVIVLEEGRVVEQGTYGDLLAAEGHLFRFHAMQTQMAS